jgi:hypothetical protein
MLHDVLTGAALAVFGSAGATAIGVIAASVAPQWQRICRLALGHVEPAITATPAAPAAREVLAAPPLLAKRFLQERPLARPLDPLAPTGSP